MGNQLASSNLSLAPWYSYEKVEKKLDTGDILLFSNRSWLGRSVRFNTKSIYCHCGIVLRVPWDEHQLYILEPSVIRESLFTAKNSGSVLVTGCIQTLKSKMYSGNYDFLAVRKINWRNRNSRDEHFRRLSILTPEQLVENFVFHDEQEAATPKHSSTASPLVRRLMELSNLRIEIKFSPDRFEKYLKPQLFASKFIFGASEEDLSMLVSGEYLASLFQRLQVFEPSNQKIQSAISKFKPKHFCTGSNFELPLNYSLVKSISKEMYVYLDFQVFTEDIMLRTEPALPLSFPRGDKSLTFNFNNRQFIDSLQLQTGDLLLFQEEGPIADAIRQITQCAYTRVAMVLQYPGIQKLFVYDVPPLFLADYEAKSPKNKLLEGRIISMDSILQSGTASKVVVRKIVRSKVAGDQSKNFQAPKTVRFNFKKIYSYVEVKGKSKNDLHHSRIVQVFDFMQKKYGPDITLNTSSIFSGQIIASIYSQLGFIKKKQEELHFCTAKFFSQEHGISDLEYRLQLSPEIPLVAVNAETMPQQQGQDRPTPIPQRQTLPPYNPEVTHVRASNNVMVPALRLSGTSSTAPVVAIYPDAESSSDEELAPESDDEDFDTTPYGQEIELQLQAQ